MNDIALFDLDNTLIPIDSDYEWNKFMYKVGMVKSSNFLSKNDYFFNDYVNKFLNIEEYFSFSIKPLSKYSRLELSVFYKKYMKEIIFPVIRKEALDLVKNHIKKNNLCCIVTATNEFVAKPIAKLFGIEKVIACELETVNNKPNSNYTGFVKGVPSFHYGKVIRTQNWLSSINKKISDFRKSYFYTDSHNDIPLLKIVTNPVATNPNKILLDYAVKNNFKILNLFR